MKKVENLKSWKLQNKVDKNCLKFEKVEKIVDKKLKKSWKLEKGKNIWKNCKKFKSIWVKFILFFYFLTIFFIFFSIFFNFFKFLTFFNFFKYFHLFQVFNLFVTHFFLLVCGKSGISIWGEPRLLGAGALVQLLVAACYHCKRPN